jgi:hypothetical protein
MIASGDRGGDDDIKTVAVTREQELESGKQGDKQREAMRAAEEAHSDRERMVEAEANTAGRRERVRRSEEVSRQIETRERRLERARPEREQITERGLGEGASLSSGEIAELKRERWKGGREAAGEAVIKRGEVVEEDEKRGGIGDDVMRRDEQEVE